jgi:hypothetical protein
MTKQITSEIEALVMSDLTVFPLQTIQSMAERWGVSKQAVNNWSVRHNDFPKPLEGVIEQTAKTPKVYPLYAVIRYENLKGLKK